ncbi:MAG: biotin transporter BioY [Firmicutes bacterium]|nr:biotin transporter BioY [Bacillota bacterium]
MNNQAVYQRSTISYLLLAALMAAVCAVCSWISIPLPFTPVPLNLGMLAVFLAGSILGWKYGSISMIVFVLLGAAGLPVFHGFTGGLGIITGPTGGYIAGYIVAAFLIGLMTDTYFRNRRTKGSKAVVYAILALAMVQGLAACYALGTAWFMHISGTAFKASLIMCVVPFLPGDALKIALATVLARIIRPVVRQ